MSYYKNGSGYRDSTAGKALVNYDEDAEKMHKLVRKLKRECDISGFEIVGRIVLKSGKTGKVYR